MEQRICTVDGCPNAHRAKGLCSTHYNQSMHDRDARHRKYVVPCTTCGALVAKTKSGRRRPVCSERCRYILVNGYAPEAKPRPPREVVGPFRRIKPTQAPTAIVKPTRRGFIGVLCGWCGASFVHDLRVTGFIPSYCNKRCQNRAASTRREQLRGRFEITKRARLAIYERDGWVCQLCHEPVDRTLHWSHDFAPSLDHIECQSWALIPDHSPSNLRLAHRLCNSLRSNRPDVA